MPLNVNKAFEQGDRPALSQQFCLLFKPMSPRGKGNVFYILNKSAGPEHLEISGKKLPSFHQILLCLLSHIEKLRKEDRTKNNKILPTAVNSVIDQALVHYNKSAIPVLSSKELPKRIIKLYHQYQSICKIKRGKNFESNKRIIDFRRQLNETMPLYPKNVIEIMEKAKVGKLEMEKKSIDEDIEFVKNMMTTRTASYTCLDKTTTKLMQKRQSRQEDEERRHARAATSRDNDPYVTDTTTDAAMADLTPGDTDVIPDGAASSTPKRPHRRLKRTGETLFIPHDILKRERIVSNYTRNRMSITSVASFMRDLIVECGGDPEKFILNYSTVYE